MGRDYVRRAPMSILQVCARQRTRVDARKREVAKVLIATSYECDIRASCVNEVAGEPSA